MAENFPKFDELQYLHIHNIWDKYKRKHVWAHYLQTTERQM